MTTTYELYTNENGTPKLVEGNAPAIVERVENLENAVGSIDVGVTSINGNKGDLTPNQTGCLPLSGGTITGTIVSKSGDLIKKDVDNSFLSFYGATTNSNGAQLVLSGKDRGDGLGGQFSLYAKDGTNFPCLAGKPDGTLKWNGNNVITSAGGTMTGPLTVNNTMMVKSASDSNRSLICGATAWSTGAHIVLSGKDNGSGGNFELTARNGSTGYTLAGTPDGTLTWGNKSILTVVASSIKKQSGYMQFSNGFLLCWGNAEVTKDATATVTFGKAFSTVYGITTADFYDTNNSWNFIGTSLKNTSATFRSSGMPRTFYYLAYGYA